MHKFKKGDKARVISLMCEDGEKGIKIGDIVTVDEYDDDEDDDFPYCIHEKFSIYPFFEYQLELVEEERNKKLDIVEFDINNNDPNNSSINKVKKTMSKITNYVKNLALSADEKALRQVGFKTECGEYTHEAIDVVLQNLCKEKEADLVAIATGIIAEEKNK